MTDTVTVNGREITEPNAPASSRQTWAIRCASGLDVRGLNLTKLAASLALEELNSLDLSRRADALRGLESRGATGRARYEPAARTKARPSRETRPSKAARKAAEFARIYNAALDAALKAGAETVPEPMIVQQHKNVLDDSSEVVKQWHVPSGVCGFAAVTLKSRRSAFAKWCIDKGYARKSDPGAWFNNLDGGRRFGQSYEKKRAAAYAACKVLTEAGIDAGVWSRID